MLSKFLIFCSGASREILDNCPRTEKIKYSSIGATVLLTGLLAAISGGYALYTIFRGERYDVPAAMIFGILWAAVIFNLDRYIVSSLRKSGNRWQEFLYALPRFIIAILISLVIAKPLEVRIFASRIEQQILEDKRKKLEEEKLSIDKLNDLTKLENLAQEQETRLTKLDSLRLADPPTAEFAALQQSRREAENDYARTSRENSAKITEYNSRIHEINNNANNYELVNGVPMKLLPNFKKQINDLSYSRNMLINEIKAKQNRLNNIDADIRRARDDHKAATALKIDEQHAEIQSTKKSKSTADSVAELQMQESIAIKDRSYTNNFITQVEALGHLTDEPYTTVWWTSTLLMLLFIIIEIAPVMVKLISKRGPYDELLDRIEHEHYLEQQKIISDKNDELNNLLAQTQAMNKLKGDIWLKSQQSALDAELSANKTILDDIAGKQAKLATMAIDKWFEEESAKLHSNGTPASV